MDNRNLNSVSLFEGERIRLVARDPEKDAEIESRWTHDSDYLRSVDAQAAIPRSPGYIKKRAECL